MIRWLKGLYHLLIAVYSSFKFGFPGKKITVIGVTGTDGKTTTSTLIYEILKASGHKVSMITSVCAVIAGKRYDTGFHVTTPNAYYVQKYLRQAVDHKDKFMVLEVTSHALSQHRVWGVDFEIGVITNVTPEHLDWHKTFDNYLRTKLLLLKKADVAIINRDEAEVYKQATRILRAKKFITYGIRREAIITPKTYPFTTKLPGIFNRYNCLAAIAVSSVLGLKKRVVRDAISQFSGVPGRMEIICENPLRVIVDFAHTPNALDKALRTVRKKTKGRLIHVFGAAGLRDQFKRPKMGEASSKYADIIVLTEEDYRTEDVNKIMDQIQSGISPGKSVYRFVNRQDALNFALREAGQKESDTVLVTGKGHEQSLCRGSTEYPWSDQKAVRKILSTL